MNPYQHLPPAAFWRTAVVEPDLAGIGPLWTSKFPVDPDEPILTVGSCFARELGHNLLDRGWNWFDAEPAPPGLTAAEHAGRHFGEFSFRTGNIYTAALLRQWLDWAYHRSAPPDEVWAGGIDPYRPTIDPGYPSRADLLAARSATLAAIRSALARAGCLIVTLGLTEAWLDCRDRTVYPICPGTAGGTFDPHRHVFHNYTFAEVYRDLSAAVDLARAANPRLRVLLTVSPVPLTATASGDHALVATTYSKSVLRAVAGQLAQEHDQVDYFPSYDLIAGFPARARYYDPNLRTITADGVALVMRHFFAGFPAADPAPEPLPLTALPRPATEGDSCDDAVLDYYNQA